MQKMDGMIQQYNGCGACSGFWRFFRPPHYKFFVEECNRHDLAYNAGGNAIDRHIADLLLYRDMTATVKVYFYKRKPLSRAWFLALCWCYYVGVRLAGSGNFNYNKTNNGINI